MGAGSEGRIFEIRNDDEWRILEIEGTTGKSLPTYSFGCGAGRSIYTMAEEAVGKPYKIAEDTD